MNGSFNNFGPMTSSNAPSFVGSTFVGNESSVDDMKRVIQAQTGGFTPHNCNGCTSGPNMVSNLSHDQFEKLIYLLNNTMIGTQMSTVGSVVASVARLGNARHHIVNQSTLTYLAHSKATTGKTILPFLNRWILYSGATDHITCSILFYTSCYPVVGIFFQLPNKMFVKPHIKALYS